MKELKMLEYDNTANYIRVISKEEYDDITNIASEYAMLNKKHQKDKIKELLKTFEEKYNIPLLNIISKGEPKDINSAILHKLIDSTSVLNKEVEGYKLKTAYKCYHIKHHKGSREERLSKSGYTTLNTIIHEDMMGSWKCVLGELRNPEYVLIYKKERNE